MSGESSSQPPRLTILQPDTPDLDADIPRTVLITGAAGTWARSSRSVARSL